MGDPARMQVLRAVLEEIKRENLLLLVQVTGEVLLSGLKELEVRCYKYRVGEQDEVREQINLI